MASVNLFKKSDVIQGLKIEELPNEKSSSWATNWASSATSKIFPASWRASWAMLKKSELPGCLKERYMYSERGVLYARPSFFGMTTSQDFWDLFAWHHPVHYWWCTLSNPQGEFCEICAPGYTRKTANGGPFEECVPCECNSHNDGPCDPETGVCNCIHKTTGDHCDQCLPGYYGAPVAGTPCKYIGVTSACRDIMGLLLLVHHVSI